MDKNIKVTIKYRIYKEPNYHDGLLKRPKFDGFRGESYKYDDSDTIEECLEQVKKNNDWTEYLILPVTQTS